MTSVSSETPNRITLITYSLKLSGPFNNLPKINNLWIQESLGSFKVPSGWHNFSIFASHINVCMKRLRWIPAVACIVFSSLTGQLMAQEGGTGIGIILGEPTGISFKTWISDRSAIDAGVAWSFPGAGAFHTHADYLWHNFGLIKMQEGKMPLYVGLGGRMRVSGRDVFLGARVPIGLAYIFAGDRLDVFVETVPVMNLFPATDFDLNAAIGIRYFFIRKG